MFTRAKKILASELMYALERTEDEAEQHLDNLLADVGGCEPRGCLRKQEHRWRSRWSWPPVVASALGLRDPRRSSC